MRAEKGKGKKSHLGWVLFFFEKLWNLVLVLLYLDVTLLIFWGFPFFLLKWGQHQHSFFYFSIIVLNFAYFILSLFYVSRSTFYREFDKKHILGLLFPLMLIVAVVGIGANCFAALSSILNDNGIIGFEPKLAKQTFEPLVDFYFWHFCDVIPQIKVNETLEWDLNFKHSGNVQNWLLLIFKIIMIFVVIDFFYKWNKWRKEARTRKAMLRKQPLFRLNAAVNPARRNARLKLRSSSVK